MGSAPSTLTQRGYHLQPGGLGKTSVQRICIDQSSGAIQPRASPSSSSSIIGYNSQRRLSLAPIANRIRRSAATAIRRAGEGSAGGPMERRVHELQSQLDSCEKRKEEVEGFSKVLQRELQIASLQARNVELAEEVMWLREYFNKQHQQVGARLNTPDEVPSTQHPHPHHREVRRASSEELENLVAKSRMEKELYEKLVAKLQSELRHQNQEWCDRVGAEEARRQCLEAVLSQELGNSEAARLKKLASERQESRNQSGDDGIVSLVESSLSFSSTDSTTAALPPTSQQQPRRARTSRPPAGGGGCQATSLRGARPHTGLPTHSSHPRSRDGIKVESIQLAGKGIAPLTANERVVPAMGRQSPKFVQFQRRRSSMGLGQQELHSDDEDTLKDYLIGEEESSADEEEEVEEEPFEKTNAKMLSNSAPSGSLQLTTNRSGRPTTALPSRRRKSHAMTSPSAVTAIGGQQGPSHRRSANSRDSGYLGDSHSSAFGEAIGDRNG